MLTRTDTTKIVMTRSQKIAGVLLAISAFMIYDSFGLVFINLLIHLFFISVVVLKGGLVLFSLKRPDHQASEDHEDELPTYCIMMPCYKESRVIKELVNNIDSIDYPKNKLQVLIVVEDNDYDTLGALKDVTLPSHFSVFLVPTPLDPKGKPNACNHALAAVTAEYLVIYDAEDRPEVDQLKKAVKRWEELPEKVVCLQGKLNYYNAKENWLSKLFTIEYTTWFDFFILGLSRLHLPIPLGGTTNHIKVEMLKAVGGWDKYNVTEDCDLGIQFASLGYKVDYLESTTYEESVTDLWAWVRQRTRWTKGYMITWLVHMRRPFKLHKNIGIQGILALQLFVLGTPLLNLVNPIMWAMFASWILFDPSWLHELFPYYIWIMSVFLLITGNLMLIFAHVFAVYRRGFHYLIPWCLLIPFYWVMQSFATYRALFQLITNPYLWEKTEHGTTNNHPSN